jgi:ubiquinone/menaquinone biosynthesis C-methylase UbiE
MATKQTTRSKKQIPVSKRDLPVIDIHRLLSLIPLFPHHKIGVFPTGDGTSFTIPIAKNVFYGSVNAIDYQKKMLDKTKESLEKNKLTNVELNLTKDNTLPIENNSLDGMILPFPKQNIPNIQTILQEIPKSLKNLGWIIAIEWHKHKTPSGPPLTKRISESTLRSYLEKVGLRFVSYRSFSENYYILLMRK